MTIICTMMMFVRSVGENDLDGGWARTTWAASIERLVLFEAGTEAKGFTPAPFKPPTVMISHAAPS